MSACQLLTSFKFWARGRLGQTNVTKSTSGWKWWKFGDNRAICCAFVRNNNTASALLWWNVHHFHPLYLFQRYKTLLICSLLCDGTDVKTWFHHFTIDKSLNKSAYVKKIALAAYAIQHEITQALLHLWKTLPSIYCRFVSRQFINI